MFSAHFRRCSDTCMAYETQYRPFIFVQIAPGVTRCILSLTGFPCNRVRDLTCTCTRNWGFKSQISKCAYLCVYFFTQFAQWHWCQFTTVFFFFYAATVWVYVVVSITVL